MVRVEPDGSIVVAGKAAPNSTGARSSPDPTWSARPRSATSGDFAIVLDEPLKPGGHELILRSTTEDKVVATSPETAVVSIQTPDGQVLALVEQPGELQPADHRAGGTEVAPKVDASRPNRRPSRPPRSRRRRPSAQAPTERRNGRQSGNARRAGGRSDGRCRRDRGPQGLRCRRAEPGRRVRVYANDILLGEAQAAPAAAS